MTWLAPPFWAPLRPHSSHRSPAALSRALLPDSIQAGEAPSAPCSISLYQKHFIPCSSSTPSSTPPLNPLHQPLKTSYRKWGRSCCVSTTRKQTDKSLWFWCVCLHAAKAALVLVGCGPQTVEWKSEKRRFAYWGRTEVLVDGCETVWRGQIHGNVAANKPTTLKFVPWSTIISKIKNS